MLLVIQVTIFIENDLFINSGVAITLSTPFFPYSDIFSFVSSTEQVIVHAKGLEKVLLHLIDRVKC